MPSLIKSIVITIVGISLYVGLYASTVAIGGNQISYFATKILQGGSVRDDVLKDTLATSASHRRSCATAELSESIIVRLRLFEKLSGLLHIEEADLELATLSSESRDLAACQPTASFTWLLRFWLNAISGRADLSNWKFLEQSYEAGLYDGWVAARRSQLAVASFDLAPEPIKSQAIQEFKALLKYDFVYDEVRLFASGSKLLKRRFDEAAKTISLAEQQSFSSHLEALTSPKLLIDTVGGRTNKALSSRVTLP